MKVVAHFEPGISVIDFELMLSFYRDILGMKVFSVEEMPSERALLARIAETGYRLARLETDGGDRLKLAGANSPPAPQPEASSLLSRHGFAYLTFIVPDLDALMERLRRANVRMFTGHDAVHLRPGVVKIAIACDPEGNLLEFVERNDLETYRPA